MRVQLLPKSQLQNLKAKEQSREIQEGAKLAKRVDNLRELMANEESTLEKWRRETLASITKEIGDESSVLASIKSEVKTLREEKARGMEDVSQARLVLDEFKKALDDKEEILNNRDSDLLEKEQYAESNRKSSEQNLLQTTNLRESAVKLRKDAEDDRLEARQTLETARSIEEKAYKNKQDAENALSLREQEIGGKENTVLLKEKDIAQREEALRIEKIQVKDQRETLERAMQRLPK